MPHRKDYKPSLHVKSISTKSSHSVSTAFYESSCEEDEYKLHSKMAADYIPSRPLTVSIPQGNNNSSPYCPRRPNLSEILANTAQAPYTLSEFMAYLSRKHCLETLEFTMDATRYRKHYTKMASRKPFSSDECLNVKKLWRRLVGAYIAPGGTREVNLPSDVRDHLLRQSLGETEPPPDPAVLDTAVGKIYELMEESVLVPFLNSQGPTSAVQPDSSDENLHMSPQTYETHPHYTASRLQQQSRQASASVPAHGFHRASAPATYSRSLGPTTQHSRFASGPARFMSPSSHNSGGSEILTDDTGSMSSPSPVDPMTPPTTPPMSEYGGGGWAAELYNVGHAQSATNVGYNSSANSSPRSSRAEHASLANATANQWKRVSSKLGWRKRSGGQLREESEGADRMEE